MVEHHRFGPKNKNLIFSLLKCCDSYDVLFQRRTFARLTWLEWAFLVISMLNILATAGMTAARLYLLVKQRGSEDLLVNDADFVLCILLLVNGGRSKKREG